MLNLYFAAGFDKPVTFAANATNAYCPIASISSAEGI
jgi:uncharacterized membrane protein